MPGGMQLCLVHHPPEISHINVRRSVGSESALGKTLVDMENMSPEELKLICDLALRLQHSMNPTEILTDDDITADQFFDALKLIIGNDSGVLDKKKCKKNVALCQGGRAHLPAIFAGALSDFENERDLINRFGKYPQVNMLPQTSEAGMGKIRTASTQDYRKGATDVVEKLEKCGLEDPGCIAIGMGCLSDRIAHTARSDHVIRLPRFSATVKQHVTPIADRLDCGATGQLVTQTSTVNGTSIYKIVILSQEPALVAAGQQYTIISDDCQGCEVGHLYYGIIPHPTSQGTAMSKKNLKDNVAFIQRLFHRDTCGNDTLYLQKDHAKDTRKLTKSEITKAQKGLGYKSSASKAGIALEAQHVRINLQ